jgi:hypothetical protein
VREQGPFRDEFLDLSHSALHLCRPVKRSYAGQRIIPSHEIGEHIPRDLIEKVNRPTRDVQSKAVAEYGKEVDPLWDYFSQTWLPTVHDVLHADWQDVWHLPQPPSRVMGFSGTTSVFMCLCVTVIGRTTCDMALMELPQDIMPDAACSFKKILSIFCQGHHSE